MRLEAGTRRAAGVPGRRRRTLFQRTVSATIEIDAPPLDVWAVLTDLSRYPAWNPHIREGTGTIAVGGRLTLRMYPPTGRPATIRPTVLVAAPGREWRLRGQIPGLFSGEHIFTLHAASGGTRVVQSEIYRGLLVPFMGRAIAAARTSFQAHNDALKRQVETGCLMADTILRGGAPRRLSDAQQRRVA